GGQQVTERMRRGEGADAAYHPLVDTLGACRRLQRKEVAEALPQNLWIAGTPVAERRRAATCSEQLRQLPPPLHHPPYPDRQGPLLTRPAAIPRRRPVRPMPPPHCTGVVVDLEEFAQPIDRRILAHGETQALTRGIGSCMRGTGGRQWRETVSSASIVNT